MYIGSNERNTNCSCCNQKFYRTFLNARDGIYQSSPDGKIILANPSFLKLLGYESYDEIKNLNLACDVYEDPERRNQIVKKLYKNNSTFNEEIVWKKKDGTKIIVLINGITIRNASGEVDYFEHTVSDITTLKQAQLKLEESTQFFINLINHLPDPTFAIDKGGRVIAWNKAIEKLTGVLALEMIGKGNYEYSIPFYGVRKPILIDYVLDITLEPGSQYSYIKKKNDTLVAEVYAPLLFQGNGCYLWGSASPIQDFLGNTIGAINTIKDFSKYKQNEEKLKYLSMHDSLTGLQNRRFFEKEVELLGHQQFEPITVFILDVDGLKLVNDTSGHQQGDKFLTAAAEVIKSCFIRSQAISRIGGDEFAVILPNTDENAADLIYEKIRSAISAYNNSSTPEIPLSITIGYATGSAPIKDIFVKADNYLNRNKLHRSASAKSSFTNTLMVMLKERDFITQGHADRLQQLAKGMSASLKLSPQEKSDLVLLASFHDIGKIGVSDTILFKPAVLTKIESREMKKHPEIGFRIAISSPDLAHIAKHILHHHEWWNGHGYPFKLQGENIPYLSRILTIIDAYDAITNDRPYRKGMSNEQALQIIEGAAGTQFDPELVKQFARYIRSTVSQPDLSSATGNA